jgi:hypothetical protein
MSPLGGFKEDFDKSENLPSDFGAAGKIIVLGDDCRCAKLCSTNDRDPVALFPSFL